MKLVPGAIGYSIISDCPDLFKNSMILDFDHEEILERASSNHIVTKYSACAEVRKKYYANEVLLGSG